MELKAASLKCKSHITPLNQFKSKTSASMVNYSSQHQPAYHKPVPLPEINMRGNKQRDAQQQK